MKPVLRHPWVLTEEEAVRLQTEWAKRVIREDRLKEVKRVAGVDVAYDNRSDRLVAAVVVLDAVTLETVDSAVVEDQARFPYIPGLFSFRELPPVIRAFERLNLRPDLVVCDGQGRAHPRRFGLACHLGVMFDIPAIGCGKTRLTGEGEEPGPMRGDSSPLVDRGEVVGCLLRTQTGIKPVCVSIGHLVSLETAREWVLRLTPRFRLPETTRRADRLVRTMLRSQTGHDARS
ncbi:deoxyribonuclease V [Staphylospora marina]|uniref:deoxyribonuclease V n=1 Tax=Staphylospora marina TaxID=2490858 RepID=UPI000F5BBC3A|nr:deoxyribonuclease V [Staphylospora marina]